MSQHSAGILLYRYAGGRLQVLLVHPGGPFWAGKDAGAWSIPKGLVDAGETRREAAIREFREETGFDANGPFLALGEQRQPSRKIVHVWAAQGDLDAGRIHSNSFTLEWPRYSGKLQRFPEVDRAQWFDLAEATRKISAGQAVFLERLVAQLKERT